MKRKLLFILSLVLLTGCSSSKTNSQDTTTTFKEDSSKVSTETPETETYSTITDINFSSGFKSEVLESSEKYSSFKITQNVRNYIVKDNKNSDETKISTSVASLDLINKISLIDYTIYSEDSYKTYFLASDFKRSINLMSDNGNDYYENKEVFQNMSFKLKDSEYNVGDYIKPLLNIYIPEDTKGVYDTDIYSFTYIRDAFPLDIVDLDYDRLGSTTINFVFNNDKTLAKICMSTSYFVGFNEYLAETEMLFSDYSNNELSLPNY